MSAQCSERYNWLQGTDQDGDNVQRNDQGINSHTVTVHE